MIRRWFLLLLPILLSCSVFHGLPSVAGSPPSPSLQQRRRLLQSGGSAGPRNIETFFPSNAAPAFANPTPPPPPPPRPPAPSFPPAHAPPVPPRSSDVTVTRAVVATAASTFVVSGLLFFAVHRFAFKRRRVDGYCPREDKVQGGDDSGRAKAAGNPYRATPVNGVLRAVVVDENGLDVLYWRKLGDSRRKRCAHCMQVIHGEGDGGGGSDGGHRKAGRGQRAGEDEGRIQETPLLPVDSLRSSDVIEPAPSTETEVSTGSSAPPSSVVMHAVASPSPSTALPLPPGRTAPPQPSPSPLAPPPSRPPGAPTPPPPPPPRPPSAPTPPPPPPPRPPSAPPPPPPPRAPPGGNKKNPVPPAAPPPPAPGRRAPLTSRPPTVPRSNSRPSAGEVPSTEEKPKAPAKLKPLHWDKVTTANAQHSMVWDKISDGSFRFDDDLMEALFGYVATNRKSPKSSTSSSSTNPFAPSAAGGGALSQVCLLDPRKSQNTAIVLRSLAVTREEILEALLEGRGLTADTLEKLSKLAPSKEEEATIVAFPGNPSDLADAESFLFHLLRAIPSSFARVDAMVFKESYVPEVAHLRGSLQAMEAACGELRRQGLFWRMLEAVLKAGNRMNAGTARGNAQAFNLGSLRKLSDVKSTDGKTTLLHFVVESVVRSEGKRCVVHRNHSFVGRLASRSSSSSSSPAPSPATREEKDAEYMTLGLPVVGGLSTDFANVKKASAVDHDALVGTCPALGSRVAEVRRLVASCGGGGGGFVVEMGGFLELAEGELTALAAEQARVMDLVKRTTEYYMVGAAQDRTAPPLQLFIIVKDFLRMVDQACVDIARNLQQQKRKPPAEPPQRRAPTRFPNLPAHFMSEKLKSTSVGSSSSSNSNSNSDSEDDGF
uniref:Formin-like protein n=1 Tax=Anthurium amnicola TaxID=1678845 RepID=A0A1D1YZ97_9ARAE